jgi:hypothetical protein
MRRVNAELGKREECKNINEKAHFPSHYTCGRLVHPGNFSDTWIRCNCIAHKYSLLNQVQVICLAIVLRKKSSFSHENLCKTPVFVYMEMDRTFKNKNDRVNIYLIDIC